MRRKPMPTSILKTLPEETQDALFEYLRTHKLADAVPWIFSEAGIRTNKSSVGEWRGWYEMRRNIDGWNAEIDELKSILRKDAAIDEKLIPSIGEAVFLSKAAKEGDAKLFASIAKVVQKGQALTAAKDAHQDKMKVADKRLQIQRADLERKNRDLEAKLAELNRQREAAAKALAKEGTGGMSAETVKVVREALGMKLDDAA